MKHPMDKEFMQLAAQSIHDRLPDNYTFILLATPVGEGGRLVYASNMHREDAIKVMKEFLLKAGAAEDWMKHIK